MDFLRHIFNREAKPKIPQTYLRESDVLFILGCDVPHGGKITDGVGDPDSPDEPYASYTFQNCVDGKTFELGITSRQEDGQIYNSYVRAERVAPGVLDIKAIVFDNEPETLRNAKEIYSVLNYLGNQVRSIFLWGLPAIHENKGEFSRFGRFMTRLLPQPSGGGFF